MRQTYRSISDVLQSPWAAGQPDAAAQLTDRILRSTRLEDSIYADLRSGDDALTQIEQTAEQKLRSFPALSRDIYQSFYSLIPRRNDDSALSAQARKFNTLLLDHITQSEDFPTLKAVCEGRELPAYEAASEFISQTAGELDELLANIGGEKNALNTLEKLENAQAQAQKQLAEQLEWLKTHGGSDQKLERQAVASANRAESKRQQVTAVNKMIDANTAKNKEAISALVTRAVHAASDRAGEIYSIIAAWGNDPGDLKKTAANTALLDAVRKSRVLRDVSKYLGRFREMFVQGKRNGYTFGRGEKYSLELGNDL